MEPARTRRRRAAVAAVAACGLGGCALFGAFDERVPPRTAHHWAIGRGSVGPLARPATVWLRIRGIEDRGFDRGLLEERVRRAVLLTGWDLADEREHADCLLDVRVVYWGTNAMLDESASTVENLDDGLPPDLHAAPSRGRHEPLDERDYWKSFAVGGIDRLVGMAITPGEWNLVLDLRVTLPGEGDRVRDRLVAWARGGNLDEQGASGMICGEVEAALLERLDEGAARPQ